MKTSVFIRYVLYLLRWQLSSPIIAIVIGIIKGTSIVGTKSDWVCAFWANLIGGVIFFWIDRLIFTKNEGKKVVKSPKTASKKWSR